MINRLSPVIANRGLLYPLPLVPLPCVHMLLGVYMCAYVSALS